MENTKSKLREKAMRLPETPGVYLMHNAARNIIYIGKSKTLKNRVSQYFGSSRNHPEKVKKMVSQVADFEYILTDSEFEALILECSLIKQHTPKYNILLKDDKGYHYIKVTKEEWPKIQAVKQVLDDQATYIGPYTSGWAVKKSVEEALKIFLLPSCSRKFPKDIGKGRPCLNFYIKQCCAPCRGKIKKKEYLEAVEEAIDFLRGGNSESIRELTRKMNQAAENLEFERAAKIRDRISAIKRINDKQKVVETKIKEQDVIALAQAESAACFEVFRFSGGRLTDREEFLLGDVGGANTARSEFLEQYYLSREKIPPRIVIDGEVDSADTIEEWLSQKAGRKVKITVPKKGEQHKILSMCKTNASEKLAQKIGRTGKETAALEELQTLLGLEKTPIYLEAYDISNLAGEENVGAMVVFENGRPLKSAYRKFKIRSVVGQDDYASMQEVIARRLKEYELHKEERQGFGRLPDLILLDGGKGHVSAVRQILDEFLVNIPLFGMVKDDKHRTRAIAKDGGEIAISSNRQAFTLVSLIQDEVHRFAIGFHRQQRKRKAVSSTLQNIPGIGNTRMKILLTHFRTIGRIREASVEELASVKGMTRSAAISVYHYFHKVQQEKIDG